jgi:hypothetical protein
MEMKKETSMVSSAPPQNPNATKLRTELKDLAFYTTKLSVIDGKVNIEVPKLPDNLTTWSIA